MLRYNFDRVFKAKGIDRPFTFLRRAGFSDTFASKVKNNRVKRLDLHLLERLCLTIGCTPNDVLEWSPDKDRPVDKKHPINAIKKTDKVTDMTKLLNSIPVARIEEIESLIKAHINTPDHDP